MKFPLITILFAFACLLSTHIANAASPSPSPSPSTTPTPSVTNEVITQNIKERLKETINEVSGTESKDSLIGYVGKVKDIVQETIIIEDKSGKINVLIGSDTAIVRSPGNASIKLENVKIDDGVIVIGIPKEEAEVQGKRIIVSEALFSPPLKTSGIGEVTKMTNSAITIKKLDGKVVTVDVASKTVFKSSTSALEYENIELGDTILYSASVNEKNETDMTATVIMQIKSTELLPSPSVESSPKISPRPYPSI